jgi:hypothetical protein
MRIERLSWISLFGSSALIALVTGGCGGSPGFTSQAVEVDTGHAQYLSLPFSPQSEQAQEASEMAAELGGHFIWKAPLENGQPPPFGSAPSEGAGQPTATATFVAAPGSAQQAVNVSNAADSYQGETGAASNGTVLVGGSNSIYPGACGSNPCYVRAYTTTNGTSFTSSTISGTWGGTTFGITFDPAIDVDTSGNFYYVLGGAPLSGNYPNSIAVSKAGPTGLGWSTPVAVTFNTRTNFDDKYYIAVDRSSSAYRNRIYVGWDRNVSNNQILYVSYSSNGGASFSAPIKVDDGTTKFERVIGAYPAVDHNTGTVYMSWHNYSQNIIYVDRSTTGGSTWGTDVAAATTHTGFGIDIGCVGGRTQGPAHHLRVGPSGTLHLVYADSIQGRGFDILYTRSTNGGQTWSAPVRVNNDAGSADQFHPTLAVSSNGAGGDRVAVSFYDRRDDASNCLAHVYSTVSTDSGLTWSANTRLTTAASNFDGNSNGPGDYSSSATLGASTYPFHSDHSASNYEVYTAPF